MRVRAAFFGSGLDHPAQAGWAAGVVLTLMAVTPTALAVVNLEWRPGEQAALVGDTIEVGLYAVPDAAPGQAVSAMDVILPWDAGALELLGVTDNGPYGWLFSGFTYPDPYGLNGTFADGDALYTAFAQLGNPAVATPAGLLVTTVRFRALAESPDTEIGIPAQLGSAVTKVYDGYIPNYDIHGELGSATIEIEDCAALDYDADGDADLADFAELQACFTGGGGVAPVECRCVFDSDGDRDIDLADYAVFHAVYTGP